jgi:hypothetical protein
MSSLTPFIKWGTYKSTDQNNPDVLELKVRDTETFETAYSINAEVSQKTDEGWQDVILPLKSHDSKNASLLDQWMRGTKDRKLKKEKVFKLKTWLGQSKFGRPIRRFSLEF